MNSMKKTGRPEAFSKKAKGIEYVMRISYDNFNTPAKLDGMIRFCRKAGIREVQLVPVSSRTDGSVFPPRKIFPARRRRLSSINAKLRANGITPGYCVVRTFMATSVTGKDYIGFKQPRVDMQGTAATLHPCPLDTHYLDYMRLFYAELARTAPATMLVDDDFRYEYLAGMGPTCFCPLHLKEFRRRYTHTPDREALKAVLEDAQPSRMKNDWMEFKRVLLVEFARVLRDAVHEVDPKIRVGLMLTSTEISALEGRDHRELVETFAGDLPPLVRPGQGCYADTDRLAILSGLVDTAYQSSLMPADTEIQAEIDFYPHQVFNKSAHFGFDFQAKANLACGIRKINIWPFGQNHDVTETHPYADYMKRTNPVLSRIVRSIPSAARMRGVQFVYSQKAAQLRSQRPQDVKWFILPVLKLLWRLGVPFTFDAAPVAVLTKDSFPMARDQAEDILENRNVLMDSDALDLLSAMGLKHVAGLKNTGVVLAEDRIEELIVRDERNGTAGGGSTGTQKAGRFVKWTVSARSGWQPLTRLASLNRSAKLPGMLAAEKHGRRLVVCPCRLDENGYWANHVKHTQVQGVLAWLQGGALPAVVRDAPDVCPVLLDDESSNTRVLSLINVSTACADGITVEVAAPLPLSEYQVEFIGDDGRLVKMKKRDVRRRRGALHIKIAGAANVLPYHVRFILIKTHAK